MARQGYQDKYIEAYYDWKTAVNQNESPASISGKRAKLVLALKKMSKNK